MKTQHYKIPQEILYLYFLRKNCSCKTGLPLKHSCEAFPFIVSGCSKVDSSSDISCSIPVYNIEKAMLLNTKVNTLSQNFRKVIVNVPKLGSRVTQVQFVGCNNSIILLRRSVMNNGSIGSSRGYSLKAQANKIIHLPTLEKEDYQYSLMQLIIKQLIRDQEGKTYFLNSSSLVAPDTSVTVVL